MSGVSEPQSLRSLFINSLRYETTEASLKSHFEKFGEIVHCSIKKDPNTGKSRGFGFITYKSAHMVDDAQAARPHKIDGRVVKSKRTFPREQSSKPGALGTVNKIYIRSIAEDISKEDLRKCFDTYGNIVGVNIVTDKETGKRKGYAFVEFDDYDPVDKIVLHPHECKGFKLDVSKALSHEEKEYVKLKKEMQGGARGVTGQRLWHEYDGYGVGGYGRGYVGGYSRNCYNNSCPWGRGCSWNVGYVNAFPGGRGSNAWRGNFRSSYGRIPVQVNTGYVQRMPGHNYGGQGSGVYGPREVNR